MWSRAVEKRSGPRDEPELIERFRQGDPAAFDRLVREHRQAIYGVARRLLGTHEDADEAAQLAFVRAWRSRSRFRGDAAMRTWLTRIVLNVAKSMRTGRWARNVDGDVDERLERVADPTARVDDRMGQRQLEQRVRRAVSGLPRRQREVVLLKVFSEMTYREVADVLELSEGAVKAHLHQAVSNLRRRLAGKRS